MSNRLGGFQGTAYLGTNANQPPNWTFSNRAPNQYDTQNVSLGDLWLDKTTEVAYMLVSLQGDSTSRGMLADWVVITGGSGSTIMFTTDLGTNPVVPDGSGNVNVIGSEGIVTFGSLNTISISIASEVPNNFTADSGTTTALANNLNIFGGTLISTTAGLGTITINATDSVASNYVTDSGTATPSANSLNVLGGNNIVTSGVADTLTIDLNGTTNHAIQVGNSTGSLTSIGVGSTGQLLVGATAADPAFAASANGDFTFTSSTAAATRTFTVTNTDNTNSSSSATSILSVGGTSAGDAFQQFAVGSARAYSLGPDTSASQILKINTAAAGTVTPSTGTNLWSMTSAGQRTMPLQPCFLATLNAEANVTGDGTGHFIGAVTAVTEVFDIGNNLATGGGGLGTSGAVFTAPITGVYVFGQTIPFLFSVGGGNVWSTTIAVTSGGTTFYAMATLPTANQCTGFFGYNSVVQQCGSLIVQLTAGNTVQWTFASDGGAKTDDVAGTGGQIWGALLF